MAVALVLWLRDHILGAWQSTYPYDRPQGHCLSFPHPTSLNPLDLPLTWLVPIVLGPAFCFAGSHTLGSPLPHHACPMINTTLISVNGFCIFQHQKYLIISQIYSSLEKPCDHTVSHSPRHTAEKKPPLLISSHCY